MRNKTASRQLACLGYLLAILVPSLAGADMIFGSIYFEERQLSNQAVKVHCDNGEYEGRLGERGEYRVFVGAEGKCELRIEIEGQQLTAEVRSYDEPVRYDFSVVQSPTGYKLVRK